MEKQNRIMKKRTHLSFGTTRGIISDIISLLLVIALWYVSKEKAGNVILTIFIIWGLLTVFCLGLDIYLLRKHR